jgi:N-acyl homoserine lactone hydrolase
MLNRRLLIVCSPFLFFGLPISPAQQDLAQSIPEIHLYAMQCGYFEFKDLGALFVDTGENDGKSGSLIDTCYLVRHPKGILLWDTGLPDQLATSKDGMNDPALGIHMTVPVRLADQLQQLHLRPADIAYIAFSHFHSDHTGNAGLFSASTWIVNKTELAYAQRVPAPLGVDPAIAEETKGAKLQLIDGDYDVFGDGSVRILKTPGHTPGHQSLEVRLKHTGVILLTGDLYHMRESREYRYVPPINASRADTLASIDRFERIAKNTHARVIVQHLPVSAPDQVLVSGTFTSGVPVSLHYRGGVARDGDGLFWDIHGTEGDIRVTGPSGHTQMVQLSLKGAHGDEKTFRPLEIPASYRSGWPENVEPGNVARVYASMAHDLHHGTRSAPSFDDAVAVHRIIAAIEKAAESGQRTVPHRLIHSQVIDRTMSKSEYIQG